jgi:hypothetical protein
MAPGDRYQAQEQRNRNELHHGFHLPRKIGFVPLFDCRASAQRINIGKDLTRVNCDLMLPDANAEPRAAAERNEGKQERNGNIFVHGASTSSNFRSNSIVTKKMRRAIPEQTRDALSN